MNSSASQSSVCVRGSSLVGYKPYRVQPTQPGAVHVWQLAGCHGGTRRLASSCFSVRFSVYFSVYFSPDFSPDVSMLTWPRGVWSCVAEQSILCCYLPIAFFAPQARCLTLYL